MQASTTLCFVAALADDDADADGPSNEPAEPSAEADTGSIPFVFTSSQCQQAAQRAMAMHTEGILSPAIRASNIRHWVSNPSYLKSADWQMLTGAIGMYLLHGLMGEEQQKAIFGFLSLAAQLTSRRIRRDALSDLPRQAVRVIAEMERVLPVCESGILRHMLIHVAERAQVGGPPWTHAMWPWERLWGRLVSWLHQGNNPAVSIMNSYLAFSVSRAR